MTTVSIEATDITQVEADAMIVTATTIGFQGDCINPAVEGLTGKMFFDQISWRTDLYDGLTVHAPATGEHKGRFRSVLFVIDDVRRPLDVLVAIALQEADRLRQMHVSLPAALRTMAGRYEHTAQEIADAIARGVREFVSYWPTQVQHITVTAHIDLKDYMSYQLQGL